MTLKHAQRFPPTLSRDSSFCTLLCTIVCDQSKGTRGQKVERCFSQDSSCRVTVCQQLGAHQTNLQSCGLRWISPTAFCPWIFSLKKGNSSSLSSVCSLWVFHTDHCWPAHTKANTPLSQQLFPSSLWAYHLLPAGRQLTTIQSQDFIPPVDNYHIFEGGVHRLWPAGQLRLDIGICTALQL